MRKNRHILDGRRERFRKGTIENIEKGHLEKGTFLFAALFILLFMMGCTKKEDPTESQITVSKDGKTVSVILEEFDKEYYKTEELEQAIQDEITAYEREYSNKILLNTIKIQGEGEEIKPDKKLVEVVLEFPGTGDYQRFNNEILFYGTVEAALQEGFDLDITLVNEKDAAKTIGKQELHGMLKQHILITGEELLIHLPYHVQYVTQGTQILGKKTVRSQNMEELTYILMH